MFETGALIGREYGSRWMVDQRGGDALCVRGRFCLALDPLSDFGAPAVVCHGRVPVLDAAQGVQFGIKVDERLEKATVYTTIRPTVVTFQTVT